MPYRQTLYSDKPFKMPCVESWKQMEFKEIENSVSPLKTNTIKEKIVKKPFKNFLTRQEEYQKKKEIVL